MNLRSTNRSEGSPAISSYRMNLYLSFSALCAVFAVGMWLVFLRPAENKQATGVITSKTFKPAGEYAQFPAGLNRNSFYGPNKIPIAECYILIIHVDDLAADVGYAANIPEAETYQVGQHVSLRYQARGIPGIWRKVFVIGLTH
jgi:hypothetical protein